MARSPNWTIEEDAILKKNYPYIGVAGCVLLIHRSEKAISIRASRLGLKLINAWNKKCTTQEYIDKLIHKRITNIEVYSDYINDATEILHRCIVCNNIWKVRPNNILNGSGCPECNKGFGWLGNINNKQYANLYLLELELDNIVVLKLGVTISLRKRISLIKQHTKSIPKIIYLGNFPSKEVLNLEQKLLSYFSNYKYTSKAAFGGHTELLKVECKEELLSILTDLLYEEI